MVKRNKLQKFEELNNFTNVVQNFNFEQPSLKAAHGELVDFKGHWATKQFKNQNPIVLELACGRGEYTLALAKRFPNKNFIGVDVKGARIWKGAKLALAQNLTNVAFLRTRIEQIELFFDRNEVTEIWITFPDPFLKKSKANRRLTSKAFLERYKKILKQNALCHLKTDNTMLYEYSLEVFKEQSVKINFNSKDIYNGPLYLPELEIKTYYEKMHLEKQLKIKYIQFELS